MTLTEYAELIDELAGHWGGEDIVVLIGDRHGDVSITSNDGYTKHGTVAYANDVFDGNGVYELGQRANPRFYGTMLFKKEDLAEEIVTQMTVNDYTNEDADQ